MDGAKRSGRSRIHTKVLNQAPNHSAEGTTTSFDGFSGLNESFLLTLFSPAISSFVYTVLKAGIELPKEL
jgi:hypothetical protein